jgi:hypothetical protein
LQTVSRHSNLGQMLSKFIDFHLAFPSIAFSRTSVLVGASPFRAPSTPLLRLSDLKNENKKFHRAVPSRIPEHHRQH